jgi:hypothetical protein
MPFSRRLRRLSPESTLLLPGLVLVLIASGCSDATDPPVDPPPGSEAEFDQQNLYEGIVLGQGIGRFSVEDGHGDPAGIEWDLQSAQTVTAGCAGILAGIALPIRNLNGATEPVVLCLRMLQGGTVPEPDDDLVIGRVSLPADRFIGVEVLNPRTWPVFDVTSLGLVVAPGTRFCFSVATIDTVAYILNPEYGGQYEGGAAFRRNRARGPEWEAQPLSDFGFRTWVAER